MKTAALRLFILLALLVLVGRSPVSAAENVELTLQDFGYGDLQIQGMYGATTVYIPFQSDWVLQEAITVEAVYSASPLLKENRSTLTVLANDLEVSSIRPQADGNSHTFAFTIPVDRLGGAGVTLRFQGYLRLLEDACEETNNPGQWITVHNNSALSITAELDETAPTLSDLPGAVVVQNAVETPVPTIFVLPDTLDTTALTVSAQAAARLSRGDQNRMPIYSAATAETLTEQQRQEANLVLIGLEETQPLLGELDPLPEASADSAIFQIANSPWNAGHKLLVISGASEAGLQLAGDALMDTPTFSGLQGEGAVLDALTTDLAPIPTEPWLSDTTTFAQLGDRNRTVTGTGIFHEYYYFRRPPGWILESGAQVTLNVAFSPALRASESYISAFINDVFVGTIRTGENRESQSVTFDLPVIPLNETPTGERPQELILHLLVANHLIENNCEQTHPDAAWTRVYADSSFTTPHVYLTGPDLQAFPYPMVSDQGNAPTAIILPVNPDLVTVEQGLKLAATFGRYRVGDLDLVMTTADQVTPEAYGDRHLVIIGTPGQQPLISEFLTVSPVANDAVNRALNAPENGMARQMVSPWNAERLALLLFGASAEALEDAVNAFTYAAPPVGQPGSVAVIAPDEPARIIYRSNNASPDREPGQVAREPVVAPPEPWLVVTLILAATAIGVVGIVTLGQRRRS